MIYTPLDLIGRGVYYLHMRILSKIKELLEPNKNNAIDTTLQQSINNRIINRSHIQPQRERVNQSTKIKSTAAIDSKEYDIYQNPNLIPPEEKHLYQSEEYYNQVLPFKGDRAKPLSWYVEKYGTLEGGLIAPDIVMLKMCAKYPNPKGGYPAYWWFKYGIRNVGARYKYLEGKGLIVLDESKNKYKLTGSGEQIYKKYEYVYHGHLDKYDENSAWNAKPAKYKFESDLANVSNNDGKWRAIQERKLKIMKSGDIWDLYMITLKEADFLYSEKNYIQAETMYLEALRIHDLYYKKEAEKNRRIFPEYTAPKLDPPKHITERLGKCRKKQG